MSKNNENKLVPRLRFPEFTNENWNRKTIDETCEILNNFRKPLTTNLREKGVYPYYGASGIIDYVKDYIFNERLLLIGEDGAKWLAYEKTAFIAEGKYWVNNHAHVLKPIGVVDTLLENYLVKLDISPFITGAAPPKLTLGKLKSIPVPIPENQKEQQKIAACLSSLDDVITAESKKLEVLKEHKKGLLQNLFPQQGETVPKLRFKEFEDSGEWKEKYLNEISPAIFDGTHQTPSYTEKGVPFYSVENIKSGIKNKFISREDYLLSISKNKPEKGDIIITRIGDIGTSKVIDWNYEFSIYVTLAIVKKSTIFNSYYLHSFFQSSRYQKEILSKSLLNAVPCKINMDELRRTKILIPPDKGKKEQLKISEIFSSVDDLINSQSQKIETLKLHKKGLLQGLFPDINEHNG